MDKPLYFNTKALPLEKDFQDGTVERMLKSDETLELIEGPKSVTFKPAMRIKVRCMKDKSEGYITSRDKMGVLYATLNDKVYTCKTTVAMTDALDLKDCKVVKKLPIDDLFTALDEQIDDSDSKLTRVRAKCSDGKEGYITLKGNAGTTYAELSGKHWTISKEVPLTKVFKSLGAEEIRTLEEGELLEVLEAPKEEAFTPEIRLKCKAMSDGCTGWLTFDNVNVLAWSKNYKCCVKTPLHETLEVKDAKSIRDLTVGESFDLVQGPIEIGEGENAELRMKGKALRDGTIGWVTIRDATGKRTLQPKVQ